MEKPRLLFTPEELFKIILADIKFFPNNEYNYKDLIGHYGYSKSMEQFDQWTTGRGGYSLNYNMSGWNYSLGISHQDIEGECKYISWVVKNRDVYWDTSHGSIDCRLKYNGRHIIGNWSDGLIFQELIYLFFSEINNSAKEYFRKRKNNSENELFHI